MMAAMMTLVFADRPEVDAQWAFAQSEAHKHGSLLGVSAIHLWHGFTLLQYGELAEAADSLRQGQEEFDAWGFGEIASRYTSSFLCRAAARARPHRRGALVAGPQPTAASARTRTAAATGAQRGWRCSWPRVAPRRRSRRSPTTSATTRTCGCRRQRRSARTPHWRSTGSAATTRRSRSPRRSWPTRAAGARRARSARRCGSSACCAATWSCCRRRPTCSSTHTRGSSSPRRSPTSAPRCGASGGRPTPASRSGARSSWPTRARPKGSSSTCARELYAAGARPRTSALGGVDALTASERRVAAFAAEGQSNRDIAQALFVTPKTVEVHLSNAYRKLGIRSRRDLAGALPKSGDDV